MDRGLWTEDSGDKCGMVVVQGLASWSEMAISEQGSPNLGHFLFCPNPAQKLKILLKSLASPYNHRLMSYK